jgi:hypothetical protein
MSVKPVPVSSVLPPVLREPGNKPSDHNRFAALAHARGQSPSTVGRSKSPAVKRPASSDDSGQPGKNPRLETVKVFHVMEGVEKLLAKGRDNIDNVKKVLINAKEINPTMKEIFGGMTMNMEHITDAVELLASILVDLASNGKLGAAPDGNGRKGNGSAQVAPPVDPEVEKKRKFVNVVREAEKAVLLFDLDLGKVPIMNTATIAKNVTHDITVKAAVADGKTDGRPADTTVVALDDALSMVTGMDFLGKVTKPFNNKFNQQDPKNGKFCTMPVRMNFNSKEARTRAEKVLKKQCKVRCVVPYPQRLRNSIKNAIQDQKVKHPNCFIQVKVDAEALCLRLSRKEGENWHNNYDTVNLSDEVLDTGFVGNAPSQAAETVMEVSQPAL